jgi:phosphatidylinositol glycan class F
LKAAFLATLAASVAFHVVLVILGAPLTNCSTPFLTGPHCPSDNLHVRTYLLALLLSLLTVPAAAYTIGIPGFAKGDAQTVVIKFLWIRLFGELS